jgi:hypothetical protein
MPIERYRSDGRKAFIEYLIECSRADRDAFLVEVKAAAGRANEVPISAGARSFAGVVRIANVATRSIHRSCGYHWSAL